MKKLLSAALISSVLISPAALSGTAEVGVVLQYLQALSAGNVSALETLVDGPLASEHTMLSAGNQNYGSQLRSRYGEVQQEILQDQALGPRRGVLVRLNHQDGGVRERVFIVGVNAQQEGRVFGDISRRDFCQLSNGPICTSN